MTDLWQAKLVAWSHDPPEKAMVLMRDPAGHEGGTVAALRKALFGKGGVPSKLLSIVKRADHWASAADRPQFPYEQGNRFARWAQVHFYKEGELIHPLSGTRIKLAREDASAEAFKSVSLDHIKKFVVKGGDAVDARKTALALWRFASLPPGEKLAGFWELLPADTRVPDHSIWAHLDLTSAFATAMAADDSNRTPAILTVSFGPVQGFIAQARSTSDLWAGSHLLSRIAWEGIKVICERLGPDHIIFPQLRGIPQVDLWLCREIGLDGDWFSKEGWCRIKSDANPLFSAALPNKFVAIVPASQARFLAEEITRAVHTWVRGIADQILTKLTGANGQVSVCREQAYKQLAGFPEVHWAATPWSLVSEPGQGHGLDVSKLEAARKPFFPVDGKAGFLGSDAWKSLRGELSLPDRFVFYRPNPGVLYPEIFDINDRLAAASKGVRPFDQMRQEGYRCTLCGEYEWLTDDRSQLTLPVGQRGETLWSRQQRLARKGEHLCLRCALKRFWPTLFVQELEEMKIGLHGIKRYTVSTHTMALATSIDEWLDGADHTVDSELYQELQGLDENAALPRFLDLKIKNMDSAERKKAEVLARRLPVLLDRLKVSREEDLSERSEEALERLEQSIQQTLGKRPQAYYAWILMDGDRMGAWLNGTEADYRLTYAESWHSHIVAGLSQQQRQGDLGRYLQTSRFTSPARHMAISGALNGFALYLARHVIEKCYKGKLIYAGGDDLLAMIPVDDLLPAMWLLRLVYSGELPPEEKKDSAAFWKTLLGLKHEPQLSIGKGFVRLKTQLIRVMGHKATASTGAVVAHHMAPLNRVLRTLRAAEQRAKIQGGRDAFAITLLKRSGGAVELTSPWHVENKGNPAGQSPMAVLIRLAHTLARNDLSRRAAYLTQAWASTLPPESLFQVDPESYQRLLACNIAHQFKRQGAKDGDKIGEDLAQCVVAICRKSDAAHPENPNPMLPVRQLDGFLAVAEFLARSLPPAVRENGAVTKGSANG